VLLWAFVWMEVLGYIYGLISPILDLVSGMLPAVRGLEDAGLREAGLHYIVKHNKNM